MEKERIKKRRKHGATARSKMLISLFPNRIIKRNSLSPNRIIKRNPCIGISIIYLTGRMGYKPQYAVDSDHHYNEHADNHCSLVEELPRFKEYRIV